MTDNDFKNLEYNKNALVKHFALYNACSGDSKGSNTTNYDAINERKRDAFGLSIQVGIYSSNFKVTDPNSYYNMSTETNQIISKIGLEAEYTLPFNKGTWSLFVNPTYEKFNPSKDYISYINNPGFANDKDPVHYNVKVNYSSIEVPVGVRRYFFINKFSKIFVNIAYVMDLAGKGDIKITNSDGLVNGDVEIDISSRNNLAFGVGYKYKRFSGEFRYNLQRQLSSSLLWSAKYNSFCTES